ncbi:unnamed protein product [Prunus armeniaca]|uniref:Uncharacterized protein n=1 Tax=Prunus armeniaca TaxID=36596 RepID=A0A6J5TS01_PRUAR|nr:unnamed protein product [Prunus armeniaca]
MVNTVLDHQTQIELCESGSEYPPRNVEDGEVDDDGKSKRTGRVGGGYEGWDNGEGKKGWWVLPNGSEYWVKGRTMGCANGG